MRTSRIEFMLIRYAVQSSSHNQEIKHRIEETNELIVGFLFPQTNNNYIKQVIGISMIALTILLDSLIFM